jgi:adenylate cyclase
MAGQVVAFFAGEHAAAASAIERALALNPNSAHAWMVGGWVQCMLNNPDSAIDSLRRGLRLSPLDPLGWMFKNWLALAHLVAGRYEDAMEWVDQSLREQPPLYPRDPHEGGTLRAARAHHGSSRLAESGT